jgi:hypothetical protein
METNADPQSSIDINLLIALLPLLLTIPETQEVLRHGRTSIEKLIRSGELKAVQRVKRGNGSRILILRSSIESYLQRNLI